MTAGSHGSTSVEPLWGRGPTGRRQGISDITHKGTEKSKNQLHSKRKNWQIANKIIIA